MMKKKNIVYLCALVYFTSYFCRKDFAILMSDLLQNNIIDKSTGGLICLALFVCYGVGQIFCGYLGDKVKPKYMISIGLIVTAICNLLMPCTKIPVLLIVIWGINGFAQSMLWPPIVRILSTRLDNENYVKGCLVVTSAAHISTILLYLYTPLCILYFSWEFVLISASLLAILTFIIFIICINRIISNSKTNSKTNLTNEIETQPLSTIFKEVPLILVFIIIVAMGFLRDGIETWLPTLYQEVLNRDSSESILVSILLPIFSILSISLTTVFHKKYKCFNNEIMGTLIFFVISLISIIILLAIINVNNFIIKLLCILLAALVCAVMHGSNGLLISCLPGRFAKMGRSATASGFCNAFTYVGAAISSYGFAILSENFGWIFTIASWAVVAVIGIVFSLLAKKKYTKFISLK